MQPLEQPGFPGRLASIFVLLSLGIAVSGFLYYQQQRGIGDRHRNEDLAAIAALKVSQVEAWRRDRLSDAEYIRENPVIVNSLARVLAGPSPRLRGEMLAWMATYRKRHEDANLILLDAGGRVRLSTLADNQTVAPESLALASEALKSETTLLSDVHPNPGNRIHLDLCIPIMPSDKTLPHGVLVVEIDPGRTLYPLIESWPATSKSGETLLVRRVGNEIQYLNELRHRINAAHSHQLPVAATVLSTLPPGPRTVGEAIDYRGVRVIAASRLIPGSTWILIAKVDREEMYGSLRQSALSTALLGCCLFVAAAAGILLLWRQQQNLFHTGQLAAATEQRALEERLNTLSRYSNDIILHADPDGRILDVNERGVAAYGYQREELLRLLMSDLLPSPARPTFEVQWSKMIEEGFMALQIQHRRKDSSLFPVEIATRVVARDGNMCCQSVIRDISRQRAAEEQLRLMESAMLQTADGILIVEVSSDRPCTSPRPIFVNAAFERMSGYSSEELQSEPNLLLHRRANPGSDSIAEPFVEFGNCPTHLEGPAWRKDGSEFFAEWNLMPLLDSSGRATHCVWTCRDVTERRRAEESLRLVSSIVESSDDAIIGKNMDGIILSWNHGAQRIYGYSAKEIIGRSISLLIPSERPDELPAIMEHLRRGESIEHIETERVANDGRRLSVSLTVSPIRDRAANVVGASSIARDITARKNAEKQLAAAHHRSSAILESISDGFNAFDREWRYTYVNASGAKMTGKTVGDLLGANLWELWPGLETTPVGVAYRRAVAENIQVQLENFYPEPLNRWFEVRCYPSPEGLTVFFSDITERKQAERATQLSEQRYRSLATATTQIVWTTDPQGYIVEPLPMWLSFTGQRPEDNLGMGWLEALHPDDRDRTASLWSSALKTRSFYETEYRMRRYDGEYRWMAAHGVPVLGESGDIRQWILTCADITDRKLAEREIHKLNQELEARVTERTSQLQEANQELEAFAYSVSHDLRAPLRAVDGFSRILLEEYAPQLPAEARHYLKIARENALQMGGLIDGLLRFSRFGRQPLCKQLIAPADLVREVWQDLRLEKNGRDVHLTVGEMAPCEGDALLLKQVFVNLLSNALKYTRAREIATIQVGSTAVPHSAPVYFVRDNGVGFDMRYRDKLFGVFQRLHRAEEYEGIGVGLATVQRIVHRHGGRVWAEGALDHGATFFFTLMPEEQNEKHAS